MRTNRLKAFIDSEAASALPLLAAAVLALVLANTALAPTIHGLLGEKLSFAYGPVGLSKPLLLWINDGLMAVFFLLVGLEIKREMVDGRLATWEQRRLPALPALMGMAVPALIYLKVSAVEPGLAGGWAIPAATDIAFAVGALALLGKHAPLSLKVMLVSVAISVLLMLKQLSAADIQILGRIDDGHDFVDLQRHPSAKTEPGILIVRPSEALFFANVERILGGALRLVRHSAVPLHTVILSLEESPNLDGTSIEAMQDFFQQMHQQGQRLILARLKHDVLTALSALPEVAGNGVILRGLSVDGAVEHALKLQA